MSHVTTGTTTLGIVCKDGIILASDTRAIAGRFIAHKKAKKIFKISDHLAMTIAGGVAVAQKIVDLFQANSLLFSFDYSRPISVPSAARMISNLLFSYSEAGTPLPLQLLIGGIDELGPHLFSLDPFGSLMEEKMVSTGSGSPIAYGVLEDRYHEDRSVKEMLPLVVRAVNSAMKRDIASGDSFDVVLVTKEGYSELSGEEKEALLKAREKEVP